MVSRNNFGFFVDDLLGYDKKIEVWVDGGVRRGTDIIKALALGATGELPLHIFLS